MIPIKDSPRTRRFPLVNIALILLNLYIFVQQLTLSETDLYRLVFTYGLIPARLIAEAKAGLPAALLPLVTYQFLHGGWLHILSNMLYLWVFGDNIEDRLGHFRYLLFYLLVGFLSGLVQVLLSPGSAVPVIGASGAVAGVLGAYLVSCPRATVLTIVPVIFLLPVTLPAAVFLGFWFILQVFSGVSSIGMEVAVAWWAHIGGFVAGMILVGFFGKRIHCE